MAINKHVIKVAKDAIKKMDDRKAAAWLTGFMAPEPTGDTSKELRKMRDNIKKRLDTQ